MTDLTHCPSCGVDLHAAQAAQARGRPSGLSTTYESLEGEVGPPRSIGDMVAGGAGGGPTWWLPSLVYLAYQGTRRDSAKATLDAFASRRRELKYAVIEEQTDDVIGFTLQPWPLVDERGRLRFPIGSDPMDVEVPAPDLLDLVVAERQRWRRLGLLDAELVERPVRIGDVYALALFDERARGRVQALPQSGGGPPRFVGGLPARRDEDVPAVPMLDITWDAREAGKLAHYAAAAGVMPPTREEAPAAMVAVAEETEARYLVGYAEGMQPRDVPPMGGAPA